MAKKKITALKVGTFTSKEGKLVEITKQRIDDIVNATHNLEDSDFPITIGHPSGSAPAWGWINKEDVQKEDDTLVVFAEEDNLAEPFLGWLKKKFYKKVSLGLRKDNSIHHLAFLGGQPPAVKGLPVTQFSDLEDIDLIEFSEYEMASWWFRGLSSVLRGIKNHLISTSTLEEAEKIIPEYKLEDISNPPSIFKREEPKLASTSFSENNLNNGDKMDLSEKELNELKAKAAKADQLETENAGLKTDLTNATTQLSEKEAAAKRKEHESFLSSNEVKTKIKPDKKNEILAALCEADNLELIEFSEGDEIKKFSVVDIMKDLIKNQPDVVSLEEFGKNGPSAVKNNDVEQGKRMAEAVNS